MRRITTSWIILLTLTVKGFLSVLCTQRGQGEEQLMGGSFREDDVI